MTKRKLADTILLFQNGEKESDRSLIIKKSTLEKENRESRRENGKNVLNKKDEKARREQEWKDKENKWEEGWHKG